MEDHDITVAMAEFDGWKRDASSPTTDEWIPPSGKRSCFTIDELPSYLTDLEAVHGAWLKLSKDLWFAFFEHLHKRVRDDYEKEHGIGTWDLWTGKCKLALIANATARQRCEAILKTIRKWPY